jgi:hypothetical protein
LEVEARSEVACAEQGGRGEEGGQGSVYFHDKLESGGKT